MAFFMGSDRYTRSVAVVASSWAFSREASVDHSLNQLELLAHLADRAVDLAVDDIVDVPAPPLVGDQRLVVDVGEAGLEALAGQRLDGEAEAVLVARLAGLVLGARHGRGGIGAGHLRRDQGGRRQAGDRGTDSTRGYPGALAQLRPRPASPGFGGRQIWG